MRRTPSNNTLFYGDNLQVLRDSIEDETVDLVYLDPPFNSNATYNVLFRSPAGEQSPAQIEAFDDTWHWTEAAERAFDEVMRSGNSDAAEMLRAMRGFLRENDMMAYLAMMAVRLIELHRVLKPTGSLYLHCDPVASHYLKILLDAVFGVGNFRSEVIWRRSSSHNSTKKQFGPIHDTILFYGKSKMHRLRPVHTPYLQHYIDQEFKKSDERGKYRLNEIMGPEVRDGDSGKPWKGYDPTPRGRHWAIPDTLKRLLPDGGAGLTMHQQLDALFDAGEIKLSSTGRPKYKQRPNEGVPLQDIWAYQAGSEGTLYGTRAPVDYDVKYLDNEAEKLGYPTQKPVGVLERILRSSSSEGDLVLDPFCGCGTTVHAAQKLNRRWIGIDVTHLAVGLIQRRLHDAFPMATFDVQGTPKDIGAAEALAAADKHQFQLWALSMVEAQPFKGGRKGADGGVDGIIYFKAPISAATPDKLTTEKAIVSVKGGAHVSDTMVKDLITTVEQEGAKMGVFLTLAPPTRPMITRAVSAGFYDSGWKQHPKIQILTVADLFDGKRPDMPWLDPSVFKKAKKEVAKADQGRLDL